MEIVKEINPNHFACSMGEKLNVRGLPTITISDNGDDTMTALITFQFDAKKVNRGANPIEIGTEMGDLFVAEFGKELVINTPDNVHFFSDSNNTKISFLASVPPGSKGNHG